MENLLQHINEKLHEIAAMSAEKSRAYDTAITWAFVAAVKS